jgi:hypothetical protein
MMVIKLFAKKANQEVGFHALYDKQGKPIEDGVTLPSKSDFIRSSPFAALKIKTPSISPLVPCAPRQKGCLPPSKCLSETQSTYSLEMHAALTSLVNELEAGKKSGHCFTVSTDILNKNKFSSAVKSSQVKSSQVLILKI